MLKRALRDKEEALSNLNLQFNGRLQEKDNELSNLNKLSSENNQKDN